MKRLLILISIQSLLYVACREKANIHQSSISRGDSRNDSLINSQLKKFALPYPENFKSDSNTLIFYGSRPLDTSFLIQINKGLQEINGVYYEIIPANHNDLSDFADPEKKLLFFEGYSFTLDSSKWEKLEGDAEKLLMDNSTFNVNSGCMDCEVYGLYYGAKSNIGNGIKYRPFYKSFKGMFLDSFIARRKPIMHKLK